MKTVKQKYSIKAPIEKVWQALTDPSVIEEWGGGPAKMKDEEGFRFSLWGADIFGTNTKVVKNKQLVQDWYGGKWDEPSIVTFNLKEENGKTEVELIHENIPDEEAKDIAKGWKTYYLGPLKELLEN